MSNLNKTTLNQIAKIEENARIMKASISPENLAELEKSGDFKLLQHGGEILKGANQTEITMINDVINKSNKVENIMSDIRKTIIAGIVTAEFDKQSDPQAVAKSKEAISVYAQKLAYMFLLEKTAYMNRLASEANQSLEAFLKSQNGNKLRSVTGATTGVPMTESNKKAFSNMLKRALKKAVDLKKITEDEAKELMISFRTDENGEIKALPPVDRTTAKTPEQVAKEKARKIDVLCSNFITLDGADKLEVLKTLYNHSDEIAQLFDTVVKQAHDLESRIQIESGDKEEQEKIAELRVLKRSLEQSEKGTKRMSKANKAKAEALVTSLSKELTDNGVDVAAL